MFTLTTPAAVERIRSDNERINAYVATRLDAALADADARATETPKSPLHGLPYGLKDEWDTASLPTTGGSHRHRDRRPTADHPVARAFDEAGAILVGKTNLSDMGLAPEAANYICGPSRNPWDARRTVGGSSGGAAAAVAARMQAFDWGTDIGGSIRLPAAFNGVLGLKLSSQTWPITDLFPKVPVVLDFMCGQGPFAHTTEQIRAILDVADPHLRTGTSRPFELKGATVYCPASLGRWPSFVSDVRSCLDVAVPEVTQDHELPSTDHVRQAYAGVWAAHLEELLEADATIGLGEGLLAVASSLLLRGRFGDLRFHPQCAEILALVAIGRVTIFRNKSKALADAMAVRAAYEATWDRGHLVVSPVCAFPPPIIGRSNWNARLLECTVGGNISDATGLAIPWGTFDGLPRAIQVLGPPGSEQTVLDVADRLIEQRDTDPKLRPPSLP